MPIFAILLTAFLEQRKLLNGVRDFFKEQLAKYITFFTKRNFSTPRELRFIYLFACLPVLVILMLLKMILIHHWLIYNIINSGLFLLSVEILTWKEEAKNENVADKRAFIHTYASNFFAALFWFLILPSAIGSICYLIIILMSAELKSKGLDLVIYNVVVDKMLFYANFIPYSILFIFIAIAGNFEEVTHYILEQRKNFNKSYYFLENMLHEVILTAIGKDKFQIAIGANIDDIEAGALTNDKFTPQITAYIVAVLYRAGLFFIGMLAIMCIVALIS